jgi:Aspartyl protease
VPVKGDREREEEILTALMTGSRASRPVRFLVDAGATFALLSQSLATDLRAAVLPEPMDVSLAARRTSRDVPVTLTASGPDSSATPPYVKRSMTNGRLSDGGCQPGV